MKFLDEIPLFDRIIALRSSGLFEGTSIEESQSFIDHTGNRTFSKGQRWHARFGDDWLFVVRGMIEVSKDGIPLSRTEAGAFASMPRLLTTPGAEYELHALELTVCVTVPPALMIDTAIDNPQTLHAAMRRMGSDVLMHRRSLPRAGLENTEWQPEGEAPNSLSLVQQIARLRAVLPGAQNHIEAAAELAARSEFVQVSPGTVLHRDGQAADHFWAIDWGVVRVTFDEQSVRLGPLDSLGFLASMGTGRHWYEAVAETDVVAIRCGIDALMDVLEEHADLARGWVLATMEQLAGFSEADAEQRLEQGLPPSLVARPEPRPGPRRLPGDAG